MMINLKDISQLKEELFASWKTRNVLLDINIGIEIGFTVILIILLIKINSWSTNA